MFPLYTACKISGFGKVPWLLHHCLCCQGKKGGNKISISSVRSKFDRKEATLRFNAFQYQPQKEMSGEEERRGKEQQVAQKMMYSD